MTKTNLGNLFRKLSKSKNLEIKIRNMGHLKAQTVPIVIGVLEVIKKGTRDYINRIPGQLSLREIQKVVLCSTAQTQRRALSSM